jgi:hypothetical protein
MNDDEDKFKTYSLEEVASMVLPPQIKDGVRWLTQRLNRGEIASYRIGRTWRMTGSDVEDLIERDRNRPSLGADSSSPQRDVLSEA